MIVEEQGIGFRTGVRFPSGPLIRISRNPAFMRGCGVLIFLKETGYLIDKLSIIPYTFITENIKSKGEFL